MLGRERCNESERSLAPRRVSAGKPSARMARSRFLVLNRQSSDNFYCALKSSETRLNPAIPRCAHASCAENPPTA